MTTPDEHAVTTPPVAEPQAHVPVVAAAATAAKAEVSNTHVRDLLATTQLNGWALHTVITQPTKDGSSAGVTLCVIATKDGQTVQSPATEVAGNVIELFDRLVRGVLEQCH